MKIHEIIRKKRKELSLTQEQLAKYLGVSTPAVNKWEKGSTYPDITILPALARLLKTDLNTLMSFQDDLSDMEINCFMKEIDNIVRSQDYENAFQMAIAKIHQYPTCEKLIYSVILYLEGTLFLYGVPDPERYKETFEAYYEQLSISEHSKIRDTAISMLIAYNRNRNNFSKAEELINALEFSSIDKEEQLAIVANLQLSVIKKDKSQCLSILKAILSSMCDPWQPQDCPLYRHLDRSETSVLSERLLSLIQEEMKHGSEFSFLNDSEEYQQLLNELESTPL